jgi:hypothetical protein
VAVSYGVDHPRALPLRHRGEVEHGAPRGCAVAAARTGPAPVARRRRSLLEVLVAPNERLGGGRLVFDLGFARERGSGLRPWFRTRWRREGSEGGAGGRLCEGERETVRYLVLCKEREKRGIRVVRERETARCKKIDKREKRGTGGRGRSTVVCHAHGLEGAFYFSNPCLHMAGAQLF